MKDTTYKRYLYAMRGLVNAKWIINVKELPLIDFVKVLHNSYSFIPKNIILKLKEIIELKKKSKEKDIIKNIVEIDNYIEEFLKNDDEAPREKQLTTPNELNKELRRIVLNVKKK